jgi:nitroimidazol reductase NimA-like FMN-containing flavoprotein (pyridoxamine 5'-phosphate oxidase superfamily)
MLGCTANYSSPDANPDTEAQDIYIHGYVSGRMFRLSSTGGDGEGKQEEEGLPITVAATHMDGLVLSLTPFHNSCNYRSAICYGYATLVTEHEERLFAMKKITDNIVPGRWENSRIPPTKAELASTSILKVRVVSASAKVRTGGPSEDRKDLGNEELKRGVWTGVVPSWLTWGEPVAGKENGRESVEGYIEKWRLEENARGKEYAFEAVEKGS